MNWLSLSSLALVLALTGCSNSPSVEQETESEVKLIEYELCLRTQEEFLKDNNAGVKGSALESLVLRLCADKRP